MSSTVSGPLRILSVHNRYAELGGEDISVELEERLLEERGHRVIRFSRENGSIRTFPLRKKIALLWQTSWSSEVYRELREIIRREGPHLAHFHNVLPLISPSAYLACQDAEVPIVQTCHNYRVFCPKITFWREGHVCQECLEHSLWRGIRYGCYRGSRLQTSVAAQMVSTLRSIWTTAVDLHITVSDFVRRVLIGAGIPADRIVVKPQFLHPDPGVSVERSEYAMYAGRLVPEKGVSTLLAAWRKLHGRGLLIFGDGPSRGELEAYCHREGMKNVEFRGLLPHQTLLEAMRRASFVIVPSLWQEPLARAVIEAFACGVPVVASQIGGLAEMVEDGKTGFLFTPGNAQELTDRVRHLFSDQVLCAKMGNEARRAYEARYTAEHNYRLLSAAYLRAIAGDR